MSNTGRRTPANSVDRDAFRDMVRKFAEREINSRWQQADREAKFPRELYVAAAKAGLIGLRIPESLDGADLGVTEETISIEKQAKANPNLAIVALIQGVAGSLLAEHGHELHHAMVRENIAGERLLALAVTEPEAGSDVQNLQTTARGDGEHRVLDGIKSFITLGGDCDTMAVLARTDLGEGRHGMHFFAVDRETPGLETSQIKTYANRPVPTYRVMLNAVRVPESRRLTACFGAKRGRLQPRARDGGRTLARPHTDRDGLGNGLRQGAPAVRQADRCEPEHRLQARAGARRRRGLAPPDLLRGAAPGLRRSGQEPSSSTSPRPSCSSCRRSTA